MTVVKKDYKWENSFKVEGVYGSIFLLEPKEFRGKSIGFPYIYYSYNYKKHKEDIVYLDLTTINEISDNISKKYRELFKNNIAEFKLKNG